MEKIDEKERFERDRAFYRLAWNDGYDKGIDDGECGRESKIKDMEYPPNSFPTVLDQGWDIGYKVGYEEGIYERCREAALEIKEGADNERDDVNTDIYLYHLRKMLAVKYRKRDRLRYELDKVWGDIDEINIAARQIEEFNKKEGEKKNE